MYTLTSTELETFFTEEPYTLTEDIVLPGGHIAFALYRNKDRHLVHTISPDGEFGTLYPTAREASNAMNSEAVTTLAAENPYDEPTWTGITTTSAADSGADVIAVRTVADEHKTRHYILARVDGYASVHTAESAAHPTQAHTAALTAAAERADEHADNLTSDDITPAPLQRIAISGLRYCAAQWRVAAAEYDLGEGIRNAYRSDHLGRGPSKVEVSAIAASVEVSRDTIYRVRDNRAWTEPSW